MKQRQRTLFILGGVILAAVIIVIVAAVFFLGGKGTPSATNPGGSPTASAASQGSTTQVVITTANITTGQEFTAANVTMEGVTNSSLPAGAYTSIAQVAGHYATSSLAEGTVVQTGFVSATAPQTTPVPSGLGTTPNASPSAFPTSPAETQPIETGPLTIAQGDVAIAVPVTPHQDVGGMVAAGDHVDILVNVNDQGTLDWVFQNVTVLKVTTVGGSETFILQLAPNQATEMALILSFTTPAPPDPVIQQFAIVSTQDYGQTALPNAAVTPSTSDQMTLSQWQNLWG